VCQQLAGSARRVIWREPNEETAVIGSVADGLLTNGVGDAEACGYEPGGPGAAFPGVVTVAGVLWTDVEYSVIGTVHDGELGAPQAPPGADL
jgi:hypothetical protein